MTLEISIHALRMESDRACSEMPTNTDISIHALRMESDSLHSLSARSGKYFYPRSPHGERRRGFDQQTANSLFLSTLSAWRATSASLSADQVATISIHALRMESDHEPLDHILDPALISIHALRMESDLRFLSFLVRF